MKTEVLFCIIVSVAMMVGLANAQSTTSTTAAPTTESPSVPQWSWTDFFKFFNSSSSNGNKFYFFF
ncbi:uncharacterized protein LOC108100254 [Drosophila ficusphila]|uniref:uncharacterized protein LOC108100254 n=1 Tax=Drosophila ficusphila TaxID=30025 RepID=UPI0007E7F8DB|nr:uncharacterized protein LOC108100254 [Drosophila ficusphila]